MPLPQKLNKQRTKGARRSGVTSSDRAAHAPPAPPLSDPQTDPPEGASLHEMRSFIAAMQAKYGLGGTDGGSPQASGSPRAGDPLHRLHAVKDRINATLASFEAPTVSYDAPERSVEEEVDAAYSSPAACSSPAPACACTCRCSDVEAEAAALKVLVADLRVQQEALRRDLEDYAASTTGAVLESLQAGLRRQQSGGSHGVGGRL